MKNLIIFLFLIIPSIQLSAQSKYRDTDKYTLRGKEKVFNTFKSLGYVTKDWVRYTLKDGKATVYRDGYPDVKHHAHIYIEDTIKYNGKKYVVTEIEENAWYKAHRVLSLRLPKDIRKIPCQAFIGCYSIRKIEIPEKVVEIDDWAFYESGIDSLILPDSVRIIGNYSFGGCNNLKYISIPGDINKIGKGAFDSCREIKTFIIKSIIPPIIEKDMFHSLPNYDSRFPDSYKARLLVPKESVDIYKQADGWSKFQIIQEL